MMFCVCLNIVSLVSFVMPSLTGWFVYNDLVACRQCDQIRSDPFGLLKVIPLLCFHSSGHDPNDYEIGKRHSLPTINLMEKDGTMGVEAGVYAGQDRFDCRSNLWLDMESAVSLLIFVLLFLAMLARVVHAVACQHLVITTETDNGYIFDTFINR